MRTPLAQAAQNPHFYPCRKWLILFALILMFWMPTMSSFWGTYRGLTTMLPWLDNCGGAMFIKFLAWKLLCWSSLEPLNGHRQFS
jgi:hypothetical protein